MAPRRRLQIGDLDLSINDPFERDIEYIYNEIFLGKAYDHPRIILPEQPTVIDVGANVGLFTIWVARKYRARTILAYEASPTTHECLVENVARHVSSATTAATCFNLAVSFEAGRELVLHQPPWNAGLSTIVDGSKLPWVDELRDKGELLTHKVPSTTVSREMAVRGLASVDLLKIDVEGYFMEVLEGGIALAHDHTWHIAPRPLATLTAPNPKADVFVNSVHSLRYAPSVESEQRHKTRCFPNRTNASTSNAMFNENVS